MTKSLQNFKQFEASVNQDAVLGVHLPDIGINSVPTDLSDYFKERGYKLEGNNCWFNKPEVIKVGGE